ncbi:Protein translocase subunit SecA [bacterium HR34]|nr:Protein translocase subunit SecA [bacterium HR34]
MSFLSKIFGDPNEKYIKEKRKVVEKINALEKEVSQLKDEQFKEKTLQLKERYQKGESLDDLLVEAFALVREAAKRTLNQRHFDVQLIGGMVLHEGKIAEMKTGEGKTLTATLPLYLNALTGKGCHLVTVNDYLAKRDTVWMGQIFDFLGLSVGCIVHEQSFLYSTWPDGIDTKRDVEGSFKVFEQYLKPVSRKEAYLADITYGTNNEFAFDYLKDNMVYDASMRVQRGFHYAIIDEVDSILIDEARTPLIISAPDEESSKLYKEFVNVVSQLEKDKHYIIEEKFKSVTLTDEGIKKVEEILGLGNIYEEKGIRFVHHLQEALKAHVLFKRDRDYVVKDGEVIIVDEFTGRLLPGRRYSGGLHQAIEAKEGVEVKPESITLASITFQNFFKMYEKLAGMTGTAATSAEEFDKVYNLEVVVVPTNKPMIRKDLSDVIFKTEIGKFKAVVKKVKELHQLGRPVLVGTTSIEKNELLSAMLQREGIPHNVLNAKNHEREGEIIAQAGRLGAVTVATNMAGRGVDIILGGNPPDEEEAKKVRELGGLFVLGTERHEARRIDNQLRGRSGRQGDPGETQFYLSLEDDLLRIFGGERAQALFNTLNIKEDEPIESSLVSKIVESAQKKIEAMNLDLRKHLLEFDEVLNKHRQAFYRKREEILLADNEKMKDITYSILEKQGINLENYKKKEKELGGEELRRIEKFTALRILDILWADHLENMEYLRQSVNLRAYGQKDPLVEYKTEGHRMFKDFFDVFENYFAQTVIKVEKVKTPEDKTVEGRGDTTIKSQFVSNANVRKVGRNDPCPCGSGKKYKKCHGK